MCMRELKPAIMANISSHIQRVQQDFGSNKREHLRFKNPLAITPRVLLLSFTKTRKFFLFWPWSSRFTDPGTLTSLTPELPVHGGGEGGDSKPSSRWPLSSKTRGFTQQRSTLFPSIITYHINEPYRIWILTAHFKFNNQVLQCIHSSMVYFLSWVLLTTSDINETTIIRPKLFWDSKVLTLSKPTSRLSKSVLFWININQGIFSASVPFLQITPSHFHRIPDIFQWI